MAFQDYLPNSLPNKPTYMVGFGFGGANPGQGFTPSGFNPKEWRGMSGFNKSEWFKGDRNFTPRFIPGGKVFPGENVLASDAQNPALNKLPLQTNETNREVTYTDQGRWEPRYQWTQPGYPNNFSWRGFSSANMSPAWVGQSSGFGRWGVR